MRPIWYSSSSVSMACAGLPMSGRSSGSGEAASEAAPRVSSRGEEQGDEGFHEVSVVRWASGVKALDRGRGHRFDDSALPLHFRTSVQVRDLSERL